MKKKTQKHYSLGYFNTARGLAVAFVIIGHSMALFLTQLPAMPTLPIFAGAGRVIGGGIMAALFMISGFYFKRRPMKRCVKVQTRLLLKPYILTSASIVVIKGIKAAVEGRSFRDEGLKLVITHIFGFNAAKNTTFLGVPVGTVSIFWFVLALYAGWIIFNRICHFETKAARVVAVISCVLIGWDLCALSSVWPMALPMALLATGYIAAGYLIRRKRFLDKKPRLLVRILIVEVSLICLAFGNVDIAACVWKLGPLDVMGSFCVGYLLLLLYSKIMDGPAGRAIFKRTDNIGIHSLQILCVHALEKAVIPWQNLSKVFPNQPVLCIALCTLCRFLLIQLIIVTVAKVRRLARRKKRIKIEITPDEEECK